jgi:hypothetical protein
MDELDSYRAFADTGCHSLHRAISDVANREDAGDIGLEQTGIALQRPTPRPLAGLE